MPLEAVPLAPPGTMWSLSPIVCSPVPVLVTGTGTVWTLAKHTHRERSHGLQGPCFPAVCWFPLHFHSDHLHQGFLSPPPRWPLSCSKDEGDQGCVPLLSFVREDDEFPMYVLQERWEASVPLWTHVQAVQIVRNSIGKTLLTKLKIFFVKFIIYDGLYVHATVSYWA